MRESESARPGADEARYRSMIESAPAYFYLAAPEDSSTLYRSPQAEAMLGYPLAQWESNPNLWAEILHPDDRERVLAEFAECGRGGAPFRCEYRLFTKAGDVRWVRDHARLVPDPSGPGTIVQGVVLDITVEKRAQQVLDTVFEHAPLGVARIGVDMRVEEANQRLRSMLWSGDGDMVGTAIGEFLPAAEAQRMIDLLQSLWTSQVDRIESDSHAQRRDGSRLWLHWNATAVREADGTRYFLVMFEDVTAKHQAEERAAASLVELKRLNQLTTEFVSVVSHEFRTALTGIQGFSEILRDEKLSRDEVKDMANDINLDARRLNNLITEMLDPKRMETWSPGADEG